MPLPIGLFNSLTLQKQSFVPLVAGEIKLYVCGITVYDYCHIGHARIFVIFDAFVRFLKAAGYQVQYVRNITDIDDKIIHRAAENKESIETLTARFTEAMHADEAALLCERPTHEPRALNHLEHMQSLITTLIQKGAAYVASSGDVLFSVPAFGSYGALSHQSLDHLQSGCRVETSDAKKNPLDFVLWKQAKPGEPAWDSSWGKGRPGWHIECSAMSLEALGETFDLHGGGFDLKFPHHENERAQSEAATGKTFVNTWMHVGFVEINQEKMAKSVGNFFTIRDVLKKHTGEAVRFFLLSTHYRSPLPFSFENLDHADEALKRLYGALNGCDTQKSLEKSEEEAAFLSALADDFNTPLAFSVLFDLVKKINRDKLHDRAAANLKAGLLKRLGGIVGLLQSDPALFFQGEQDPEFVTKIEGLITARNAARAEKDFAKADALRQEIAALGVVIEDGKGGTTWRLG